MPEVSPQNPLRQSFSVSWLSPKYRCATDTARAVKYAQGYIMPVKTVRFWTTSSGRQHRPQLFHDVARSEQLCADR